MRGVSTQSLAGAIALFAVHGVAQAADTQSNVFQDGKAGFVVSHTRWDLMRANRVPVRTG